VNAVSSTSLGEYRGRGSSSLVLETVRGSVVSRRPAAIHIYAWSDTVDTYCGAQMKPST
jgi:hypothetical protein